MTFPSFNPYSIGSQIRSQKWTRRNLTRFMFQSLFYRKSNQKSIQEVEGTRKRFCFNPYSIGSQIRRIVRLVLCLLPSPFQSLFYRKSNQKW